ncbi:MAG: response regulator [Actinobacteria bacterium]|nr:response regulator [Actinomycetota bacterium]
MSLGTLVREDGSATKGAATFDLIHEDARLSGVADVPPSVVLPEERRSTLNVLVVDDDRDIGNMLSFSLTLEGFEVSVATDGMSALEAMKATRPDVILLDVMMPVLDGYGVIERMRGDEKDSCIPVIMLSAKAGDDDIWKGWSCGADSYITKPLDIAMLLQEIERVTAAGRLA